MRILQAIFGMPETPTNGAPQPELQGSIGTSLKSINLTSRHQLILPITSATRHVRLVLTVGTALISYDEALVEQSSFYLSKQMPTTIHASSEIWARGVGTAVISLAVTR